MEKHRDTERNSDIEGENNRTGRRAVSQQETPDRQAGRQTDRQAHLSLSMQ